MRACSRGRPKQNNNSALPYSDLPTQQNATGPAGYASAPWHQGKNNPRPKIGRLPEPILHRKARRAEPKTGQSSDWVRAIFPKADKQCLRVATTHMPCQRKRRKNSQPHVIMSGVHANIPGKGPGPDTYPCGTADALNIASTGTSKPPNLP